MSSPENPPPNTAAIFQKLAKGNFICSGSDDTEDKKLFAELDAHFETLAALFMHLGYELIQEQGFYYMSKTGDTGNITAKIDAAQRLIFYLDVLKTHNNYIGPGSLISSHDLTVSERQNPLLAQKIERLKRFEQGKKKNEEESKKPISAMLERLYKDGYLELQSSNQDERRYKVLDSFRYLEKLVTSITIYED